MNERFAKVTEGSKEGSHYGFLFKLTAMALAIALVVLGAGVALAADQLRADLNTTTGGVDRTVAKGTVEPGSVLTQDVFLYVEMDGNERENPSFPFTVSPQAFDTAATGFGAKFFDPATGSPAGDHLSANSYVTITGAGTANGKSGRLRWTAPAAGATSQTYELNVGFDASTSTVTDGSASVKVTFTVAAAPSNTAPSVTPSQSTVTVNEGTQATNSGTWSDNGDVTLSASTGSVTKNPNGTAGTWSWSYTPGNETAAAGQTITITATDGGGLSTDATFKLVANNVAPTTPGTPSVPSAPSSTGSYTVSWNASSDVAADSVTYTLEHKKGSGDWSEAATGLTSASYTFGGDSASEDEGSWTYRVKASDGTDSSAYSSTSSAATVDKTGPSIAVDAVDADGRALAVGDWTNKNVTVTFSCEDAGSGVDATATAVTGGGTFSQNGTATSGGTCMDNAGNSVAPTDFPSFAVNIDKTAPSITTTATKAGGGSYTAGDWTNGNVSISFSCTNDNGGAPLSTSNDVDPTATVISSTTASPSATSSGACTDQAGNSATQGTFGAVNIDKTLPTISASATTASGTYTSGTWTNESVTVAYTCDDQGGSGLAGDCPANESVETDAPTQAGVNKSASANDNAGNTGTSNVINVKVDKTAPVLTCPAAPTFKLNQSGPLAVTASVSDTLSGAKTATASGAVDTSALGTFKSTVSGYDNAGNKTEVGCDYNVNLDFTGWMAPINNPNYLNKMKAGQAVPFKWRLTDANGGYIGLTSADVQVAVSGLNCSGSAPIDGVEEFTPGSSSLQNLGDGYYQLNWKSQSVYANSCRKVTLTITGVGQRTAQFTFTK
jgi:hypothetical protein